MVDLVIGNHIIFDLRVELLRRIFSDDSMK